MPGEEYVIGLSVSGEGDVNSAADSVDDLDDGLGAVADEAEAAGDAMDAAAKDAAKLASEMGDSADAAGETVTNYGEIEGALGKLGGPLGRIGQLGFGTADAFQKLGKNFDASKVAAMGAAVGVGLLAVAAIAAATAVATLLVKLTSMAIETSDAAAKTMILRERMTGSAEAAAELSGSISRVASAVPLSVSEVSGLADGLYKAGKRGAELEEALLAASYEAAGLGKNPGPELIARRMANLDVIGMKLKDSIADIFSGASTVNATSKFTKSLSGFTELFDQNHSEGRALQTLLGTIVDPLIAGLTALVPLAISAFRGMIILALDVAIAVVEARNAFIKMIPPEVIEAAQSLASKVDIIGIALGIGKFVMGLFIGTIVVLAAILGVIVGIIGAVIAVIGGLIVAFSAAAVAVGRFVADAGSSLLDFGSMGIEAAGNLVSGLVSGIQAGVGPVVEAIKAMAGSAVDAIKSALKIASPSKIFEDLGGYTGEGFAVGIEAETGAVQSSLETMVAPPKVEPPTAIVAGAGGGSGAGSSVDLSGATFNFYGVKDAESSVSAFEEALTRVLEGDAIAVGAG
jgi:hypothetical protein